MLSIYFDCAVIHADPEKALASRLLEPADEECGTVTIELSAMQPMSSTLEAATRTMSRLYAHIDTLLLTAQSVSHCIRLNCVGLVCLP